MISIIGSGKVGSTIAFLCGSSGLDDVLLVNRDGKKAIGIAFDISSAIPEDSKISVSGTSDYSKIMGSDVIVIAVSSGTHVQSRTELLNEHAILMKKISHEITKHAPNSKILIITNPVDVLTYLVQKVGKFPSKNVIGIASSLDSSRFRYLLAKEFDTNQSEISDAFVLGEHDDSMVPIFSYAKLRNNPISGLLTREQMERITIDLRCYWKTLRDFNWYSVFGIAKNAFDVVEAIVTNKSLDTVTSSLLDGHYGVSDVCMGVPTSINKDGIQRIRTIQIDKAELNLLSESASIIRNNISKVIGI